MLNDCFKVRGFEVLSTWKDKMIHIPERKTANSAGYDIEAGRDEIIEPKGVKLVPTGLKAYMMFDEYLGLHVRSSIAIKKGLMLVNSQGIVDSDYYNNPDNEGHIMVAFYNYSDKLVEIRKGDRIAQGIFYQYYIADEDNATAERQGGTGSTGQ